MNGVSVAIAAIFLVAVASSCDPPHRPGLDAPPPVCGQDGGMQCSDDPWSCAPGTTCWVSDKTENAFACHPSVSGARDGAPCVSVVGEPRCDDGYLCFTPDASLPGTCLRYCSPCAPQHGCDTGQTCRSLTLGAGSTQVHACMAADAG